MRIKFILSFFVLGIFSVAPVLADRMSGNFRESYNRDSSQESFNVRNIGASNEAAFPIKLNNFREASEVSITSAFFEPEHDKGNNEESSISDALKHGNHFGEDRHRGRGKHKPVTVGGALPSTTVDVPEPASFTLVLLGLGALGIFLYRRSAL